MLDREQYQENVVENDEQFTYSVERFEFELFDHFKTNKVVVSIKPSFIWSLFTEIIPDSTSVFTVCR